MPMLMHRAAMPLAVCYGTYNSTVRYAVATHNPPQPPWKYEPDETPKKKHGWSKDEAGFVEDDGVLVGKCPKGMTNAEAERLLNDGVELVTSQSPGVTPWRIYAIRGGVLYRAVPTQPGSYHGFPELPDSFGRLPRRLRDQVFEYARRRGLEKALREWLNQ